ncbi:MAG: hypothetical protein Q8936_07390 [Bacillota bacterium]|nr:hypothetical protein [Bacillota bacterium]
MNTRAEAFKKYLEGREFPMENIQIQELEDRTLMYMYQLVEEETVTIIISFPDTLNCVDMYVTSLGNVNDIKDTLAIYKKINVLNSWRRNAKFYIDDQGTINLTHSLLTDNLDYSLVLSVCGELLSVARLDYKGIKEVLTAQ